MECKRDASTTILEIHLCIGNILKYKVRGKGDGLNVTNNNGGINATATLPNRLVICKRSYLL